MIIYLKAQAGDISNLRLEMNCYILYNADR